jgi:hypothetical protein
MRVSAPNLHPSAEAVQADAVEGGLSRRQFVSYGASALVVPALALTTPEVVTAAELEGVTVSETIVVRGKKMLLNGIALRRRGYFKADVTALYLPERRSTPEGVLKLDGFRRIQLNILRTFTSSTISRIFIADFKEVATDDEFKKLIPVVSQIGAAYSQVRRVEKGDVVNLDWTPGLGWTCEINGRYLVADDGVNEVVAINNPLAFQIYLRMYIGPNAPETLRNGLLGLTG